ncbi:hypothetical protein C1646_763491 [Rhizophagus diaphanus]|nr:hypothetical protein C1646_763491 [Rhizophagus diaphanus] [Rhizophagus sp. MUCL 43196]
MTCSKLFSGDLPELTYEIIKYFQNDYSILHSCILVNRFWCRLSIPLLWENPFSIPTGNYNFIEIYLNNLNDDFKTKLIEYKIINNNSLSLNIMFNYSKFLKYLNTYKFVFSVEKWFESVIRTLKPENRLYSASDIKRLIDTSIFNIFVENEVNLYTLEIEISRIYYNTRIDNVLGLILQNINFIHNIKNLNLYIDYSSSDFSHYNNNNEYTLIKNRILEIINLHQNLKKILLSYDNSPLYISLLLTKYYNCSNTLNTIIFYYVDFKGIINLNKIFEQLNVLESVHIINCSSLNNYFTQQIINLTKPFKLKSLFINEISQIKSIQLLLQKSGDYLENFGYGFSIDSLKKHQLLELITKYCKNIKFLDLYGFEGQITYQIINLIKNIKQNLNYLSISSTSSSSYNNKESSSILLQNLGQILPNKLEYLCLSLRHIKTSSFEIFLKNSQNIFINKLLIYNREGQDTLYDFRDYNSDLFSSINEVKEFGLYNIKVKSYPSLVIHISDFIKEID